VFFISLNLTDWRSGSSEDFTSPRRGFWDEIGFGYKRLD